MEQTYERHLTEIVSAMPEGPCIVALVPTIPLEDAAALASDVAQRIGKSRSGHTILTSFEPHPSHIDHEIGVEGGVGLTEVLTKDVTVARAAAPGKARGFIYLPVGSGALRGEALLRSEAWRTLSAAVVKNGGTVLAVVPPTVFEAVNEGRSEGAGRRFDALVWLGPAARSTSGVQRAAIASGAQDLGGLGLPSGPESSADTPSTASPLERRAIPDRRATTIERRGPANRRETVERRFAEGTAATRTLDTSAASGLSSEARPEAKGTANPASVVGLAAQMGSGPRRRASERKRQRGRVVMIVISVVVVISLSILVARGPLDRRLSPSRPVPGGPPS